MKILIPILNFARGGGSRVLSELANEWTRQGAEVTILCPDSSDEPYFPTIAKILWVNNKGVASEVRGVPAKPSGRYHLESLFYGLKKIGKQYDLILANQSLTAWPVAFANCGAAKKFYYVQAYEPEYYVNMANLKDYILAVFSALSYHLPLKRIVNAPIYFRYKNLRATDFVPPGLDTAIFKPLVPARHIENQDRIVIGCIGRTEPEKGTIYALEAFEQLAKLDDRYFLRVAYGNLPAGWSHKNCEVTIPKNDRELADYYRSLDILLAPGTVQHGAPHYPVLEGLACGVSVVTTGYMGATENTAWLVANKQSQPIVESIRQIVDNPTLQRQKITQGLDAIEEFSWKAVGSKMLGIFAANGAR